MQPRLPILNEIFPPPTSPVFPASSGISPRPFSLFRDSRSKIESKKDHTGNKFSSQPLQKRGELLHYTILDPQPEQNFASDVIAAPHSEQKACFLISILLPHSRQNLEPA